MKILCLVFITFVLGCKNGTINISENEQINEMDTLIYSDTIKLFIKPDSSDGFRFIYDMGNEKISSEKQVLMPSGTPTVESFNNKWVYLTGGCGSGCFYGNIISLQRKDSIKQYMFPVFFDLKNHLIMFCENDSLIIENFDLKKRINIKEVPLAGPYCSYGIKEVVYNNYFINFKYITVENAELEKRIDVTSLTK